MRDTHLYQGHRAPRQTAWARATPTINSAPAAFRVRRVAGGLAGISVSPPTTEYVLGPHCFQRGVRTRRHGDQGMMTSGGETTRTDVTGIPSRRQRSRP